MTCQLHTGNAQSRRWRQLPTLVLVLYPLPEIARAWQSAPEQTHTLGTWCTPSCCRIRRTGETSNICRSLAIEEEVFSIVTSRCRCLYRPLQSCFSSWALCCLHPKRRCSSSAEKATSNARCKHFHGSRPLQFEACGVSH